MRFTATRNFVARSLWLARRIAPVSPLGASAVGSSGSVVGAGATFDKNFPLPKTKAKAWQGQDKDSFFRDKYAHIHAGQKKNREAKGSEKKPVSLYKAARSFSRNRTQRALKQGLEEVPIVAKLKKIQEKNNRKQRTRSLLSQIGQLEDPLTEYVFGTQAVVACLKSDKRAKISRLFTQDSPHTANEQLIALARVRGVEIQYNVPKVKMNLLSKNGVHNRYIVETRPLVTTDIQSMGPYSLDTQTFLVETAEASEDQPQDQPREVELELTAPDKKSYPLGLFIDQVTDVHNFGAILRSAYYLGVDFVAYSEKNCARLSPVVAKTSSGALDHINLYNVTKATDFFRKSQENGWTIVATSVTPKYPHKAVLASQLHELLELGPCIMVLGSEGDGLRKSLMDLSSYVVTLGGSQDTSKVDSLNVSVASALLLSKFFKDDAFDV